MPQLSEWVTYFQASFYLWVETYYMCRLSRTSVVGSVWTEQRGNVGKPSNEKNGHGRKRHHVRNQDIHWQPAGEIIDKRELVLNILKGYFVYRWFYVINAITAQDRNICNSSNTNWTVKMKFLVKRCCCYRTTMAPLQQKWGTRPCLRSNFPVK